MPEEPVTVQSYMDMLRELGGTLERGLEAMIADIRAGRLVDDTLPNDWDYIRHLMGRREVIVNEILRLNGPHRGPGTPLYTEIGGNNHVAD